MKFHNVEVIRHRSEIEESSIIKVIFINKLPRRIRGLFIIPSTSEILLNVMCHEN